MTPEDAPKFLMQLSALAELFDASMSEAKQQIYFEALIDLSLDDITRGIQLAASFCKFMPKPVEIREQAYGTLEDRAEEAWAEFREAVRNSYLVRVHKLKPWDEENEGRPESYAVEHVFGSFSNACEAEYSEITWNIKKREFLACYKSEVRLDVRFRADDARKLLSTNAPKTLLS